MKTKVKSIHFILLLRKCRIKSITNIFTPPSPPHLLRHHPPSPPLHLRAYDGV